MKVMLDANFLVDAARFGIGLKGISELVDSNCSLVTIERVVEELRKLAKEGNRWAKVAMKMIELENVDVIKTEYEGSTDEIIVSLCKSDRAFIAATNDRELRNRLKGAGVKAIYIRAKKHLAID